jgi:hypothetical protein
MSVPPRRSRFDELRNPIQAACKSLIKYIASTGNEIFESVQLDDSGKNITVAIFVVTGDSAADFHKMAKDWLSKEGFEEGKWSL